MKSGNLTFQPNEWKKVASAREQYATTFSHAQSKEPSAIPWLCFEFLIKAAEDISTMTKMMAGEIPANMPATTAMAALEQGMQPFKAVLNASTARSKASSNACITSIHAISTRTTIRKVLNDEAADVDYDFNTKNADILPISDPDMMNNTQQMIRAARVDRVERRPTD